MDGQQIGGIAFLPPADPLGRTTPLPFQARYNVFGVPLLVATNAPRLEELAREAFGHWGNPVPLPETGVSPLRLHLCVQDAPSLLPEQDLRPVLRMQEAYFLIAAEQSLGFADRTNGFATAFITPALLSQPDRVRSWFIECLGIYLACGKRKATLHAAAVAWNGRALLLTGADGAGKSTLAYACVRAGAQLLAEDMVCVEEEDGSLTGWGDSRFLHLLPDAVRFFPELQHMPDAEQFNGETKRRIRTAEIRQRAGISHCDLWGVCSLQQSGESRSHLRDADLAHIRRVLTQFKGDPLVDQPAMQAAVDRLLQTQAAHLEVGTDLDQAVDTLREWQCSAQD